MKKLMGAAGLLVVVPIFASGQNTDPQYHVQGYFFAAGALTGAGAGRSGISNSFELGGGGEWLSRQGIGVGGEYFRTVLSEVGYSLDTRIGSINASYHFGASRKSRKVEPFVTGGYTFEYVPNTLLGHDNGWNFGVGVNAWLARRVGLRLEIRDDIGGQDLSAEFVYAAPFYLRSSQHLVGFRVGVTFR